MEYNKNAWIGHIIHYTVILGSGVFIRGSSHSLCALHQLGPNNHSALQDEPLSISVSFRILRMCWIAGISGEVYSIPKCCSWNVNTRDYIYFGKYSQIKQQ